MYLNRENQFVTKIDSILLEELRQTNLPIKFRVYAIKLLDELIQKKDKLEYSPVKSLIKRMKVKVCATHSTIHYILNYLKENQFILFFQSEQKNQYGKNDYSAQIEQNYHNQDYYTFTEKDVEYEYLKRSTTKKEIKRTKRHNDVNIGLLENDLERIKQSHPNVYQTLKERLDGLYIRTPVKKGMCGREYSMYTNLPKSIRASLVDLNTGGKLESIDITACQISLALGLIKNTFSENATPELIEEINTLENIQRTISFHTFFQKILESNGVNVSRDCIKPLVFKMLFGNFNQHKLNVFKNGMKEEFQEKGFDVEIIWQTFLEEFKLRFSNVYKCLNYLSKKADMNNTTLAAILQKKESEIMISIKTEAKKQIPGINFFTVFDSIYFPKECYNKMRRVFKKIQNTFSKKNYSFNVKFNNENSPEEKTLTEQATRENNYVSFSKEVIKIKNVLKSILQETNLNNISFNPS